MFSDCTLTCGGGSQTRRRECVGGEVGDPGCLGATSETQVCNGQVGSLVPYTILEAS